MLLWHMVSLLVLSYSHDSAIMKTVINGGSVMATKKQGDDAVKSAEKKAGEAAKALDAKLSGPLAPIEKALDDVFGEKSSITLPKNAKEGLVKIAPWLALIGGILGIFSAISLWRAAHYVNVWVDYANQLSAQLGGPTTTRLGLMFWLSLIATIVFALLALLAFPGLKDRKKTGWNLAFYSALAQVVYGVISLFYSGGGFGSFLMSLVGAAVGFFLLFQVRSYYK